MKRLKITMDVKIDDFQLEDAIMELAIKGLIGKIADQTQKLGTGKIYYEISEE